MGQKTLWFKPLRGKPRERGIIGFDIEGVGGPGGFVCGAIVGDGVYHFYTDREAMHADLIGLARDGYWCFAHNLQYDLPILEGDDFPCGDLLFTRSNLLWASYPKWGRSVRIFDSANLFPRHRVSDIGMMVGYPKLEIDDVLLERLARGVPWSHFTERDQDKIRRYCLRDAEIIFMGVSQLQEVVNRLGGALQPTIAGVAMDLYRRQYHRYPWPVVGPETNKLARPAFYGGRVENFAYGLVDRANMYDVTSLYPYVQATARYPHPAHLRLDIEVGIGREWLTGEGVVQATVIAPEVYIPLLPHRFDRRLFFPYGRITGCWPIVELRAALDSGYRLESVDWVLWSKVTFNPFTAFVEDLFRMRQVYLDRHEGMANIIKLVLNSLYGRWGLNPEGGLYKLVDLEGDVNLSDYQGWTTHRIGRKLYAFGSIEASRPPDYINLLFAAQTAAAARLHLYRELAHQGEDALYCDTDSIITRGEIKIGSGLGDWRLEMYHGAADLIGPKEYALHDQALGDQYVVKGVPPDVARQYIQTGVARFFRAVTVREALRSGQRPATWVQTVRSSRDVVPKRCPWRPGGWDGEDWTLTYPFAVDQLPEAVTGSYSGRSELVWDAVPKLPVGIHPRQAGLI